jgi:hypothetical protein
VGSVPAPRLLPLEEPKVEQAAPVELAVRVGTVETAVREPMAALAEKAALVALAVLVVRLVAWC